MTFSFALFLAYSKQEPRWPKRHEDTNNSYLIRIPDTRCRFLSKGAQRELKMDRKMMNSCFNFKAFHLDVTWTASDLEEC